jgi:hypothetical protein
MLLSRRIKQRIFFAYFTLIKLLILNITAAFTVDAVRCV